MASEQTYITLDFVALAHPDVSLASSKTTNLALIKCSHFDVVILSVTTYGSA